MSTRGNEKERIINLFIARIFKCRVENLSKPLALIKAKRFITLSGKKWNNNVEQLFENTWKREIPSALMTELKREIRDSKDARLTKKRQEEKAPLPKRIQPNKPSSKLQVEVKEDPTPERIQPNKKRAYFRDTPRFDEPDDIDDPKWDEPLITVLVKEEKKLKKCANCGNTFTREKESDPRMLCKECNEKLKDSFNDSKEDYTYASTADLQRAEKNRILKIQTL